jgi:hypothetical protein
MLRADGGEGCGCDEGEKPSCSANGCCSVLQVAIRGSGQYKMCSIPCGVADTGDPSLFDSVDLLCVEVV